MPGPRAEMDRRSFLIRLGGVAGVNIAERLAGLVLGVLLVRWLGTETYGLYAFAMAFVSLAGIAVLAGLPHWLLRDLASLQDDPAAMAGRGTQGRVFGLVALLVLVSAATGIPVLYLLVDPGETRDAFLMALWLVGGNALLVTVTQALRAWSREVVSQVLAALVPTLATVSLVALAALGWRADGSAALVLGFRALAVLVALGAAALLLRRITRTHQTAVSGEGPGRLEILRQALPFLLIDGVMIVLSRSDIIMLGSLTTLVETGLYNIGMQGAGLLVFVMNTANVVAVPQYARLHRAGDRAALERFAIQTARLTLVGAAAIAVVLIALGPLLLGTLFGAEAVQSYPAMTILVCGFLVVIGFGEPGFLLNMAGHERTALKVVAAGAVLNVALNAVAIPLAGAVGAAAATATSLVLQRAAMAVQVRRKLGIACSVLGI